MYPQHFLTGCLYFFSGFGLIAKPGLRRFVVMPLLINTLLFTLCFFVMEYYVGRFDHWIESYLPSWLVFLGAIIWILFLISFVVMLVFVFVITANLVAAPFNSLLAENVEFYLTGRALPEKKFYQHLIDVPRVISRQGLMLLYYLPRAFFIGILFFVPVVNTIVAFIWFFFNAWFMALTYVDYPTDNNHIPLHHVHQFLKEKRWIALGFGTSVLCCAMVPFLNFFVMPAAVAGATKFWLERTERPGRGAP